MRLFPAGAALGFVFGLGAFACSDDPELQPGPAPTPNAIDGGGAPDGTAPPAKGRALVITLPRTTIVSNLCAELTLSMTEDGAAAPFPSTGAVTITSDASTKIFATEADCAAGPSVAPTGSVDVSAGETTKSFFLRTAAEGRVTLTASASFASGEPGHQRIALGEVRLQESADEEGGVGDPRGLVEARRIEAEDVTATDDVAREMRERAFGEIVQVRAVQEPTEQLHVPDGRDVPDGAPVYERHLTVRIVAMD